MNKKQPEKWEDLPWEQKLIRFDTIENKRGRYEAMRWLINFISQLRQQAIRETLEKVIRLSDKIERGKETTFEEWRAFKHFRNTLRYDLTNLINKLNEE